LIGVPVAYVDWRRVWPVLGHFAIRSGGTTTAEALALEIKGGMRQLWICGDWQAVVLTQVHPDCVSIDFCAGFGREDWQEDVDETIRAWALELGKSRIKVLARPGWAKFARERGYRETHREFERTV
jgi:hypothetical protein